METPPRSPASPLPPFVSPYRCSKKGTLAALIPPTSHDPVPPPKAPASLLESVPLELAHMILVRLDLRTLAAVACANRRATHLVRSLRQYRVIMEHAPEAWRGVLRIRTGRWNTCDDVYDKLCTAECDECGDFGGYLYLLTCRRVCRRCLTEKANYMPLPYALACRIFGLDGRPDIMSALPRMRAVPGGAIDAPHILVDYKSAQRAGHAVHGCACFCDRYALKMAARDPDEHPVMPKHYLSFDKPMQWTRQTISFFEKKAANPYRWGAVVPAPYFNRATQKAEWGFHCEACADSCQHRSRAFTSAMFERHLKQFGDVQDGRHRQPELPNAQQSELWSDEELEGDED